MFQNQFLLRDEMSELLSLEQQGYRYDCSSDFHPCDERPHPVSIFAQSSSRKEPCVQERILPNYCDDALVYRDANTEPSLLDKFDRLLISFACFYKQVFSRVSETSEMLLSGFLDSLEYIVFGIQTNAVSRLWRTYAQC